MEQDSIPRTLHIIVRYAVRVVAVLIVVVALSWFFFFRSSGSQADNNPIDSTTKPGQAQAAENDESKTVADASKAPTEANKETPQSPTGKEEEPGKLAETGPTETAIVISAAVIGGTLFWQWRLRRSPAIDR